MKAESNRAIQLITLDKHTRYGYSKRQVCPQSVKFNLNREGSSSLEIDYSDAMFKELIKTNKVSMFETTVFPVMPCK